MNKEKTGALIAELRKEKGLTQEQLGEKLFVTDKAVSKWERGASAPGVDLLEKLAEVLGVTVTELLAGERGVRISLANLGDRFIRHGTIPQLRELCGIDGASLAKKALEVMGRG